MFQSQLTTATFPITIGQLSGRRACPICLLASVQDEAETELEWRRPTLNKQLLLNTQDSRLLIKDEDEPLLLGNVRWFPSFASSFGIALFWTRTKADVQERTVSMCTCPSPNPCHGAMKTCLCLRSSKLSPGMSFMRKPASKTLARIPFDT